MIRAVTKKIDASAADSIQVEEIEAATCRHSRNESALNSGPKNGFLGFNPYGVLSVALIALSGSVMIWFVWRLSKWIGW